MTRDAIRRRKVRLAARLAREAGLAPPAPKPPSAPKPPPGPKSPRRPSRSKDAIYKRKRRRAARRQARLKAKEEARLAREREREERRLAGPPPEPPGPSAFGLSTGGKLDRQWYDLVEVACGVAVRAEWDNPDGRAGGFRCQFTPSVSVCDDPQICRFYGWYIARSKPWHPSPLAAALMFIKAWKHWDAAGRPAS